MIVLAWVLQIFLGVVFLLHGLLYTVAYDVMARRARESGQSLPGVPPAFRIFIGVAEVAAAVGLTIPSAIGVLPWLTPLAAVGLVIVLVGAAVLHGRRREVPQLVSVLVLLVLAAATVYLRWRVVPQ